MTENKNLQKVGVIGSSKNADGKLRKSALAAS